MPIITNEAIKAEDPNAPLFTDYLLQSQNKSPQSLYGDLTANAILNADIEKAQREAEEEKRRQEEEATAAAAMASQVAPLQLGQVTQSTTSPDITPKEAKRRETAANDSFNASKSVIDQNMAAVTKANEDLEELHRQRNELIAGQEMTEYIAADAEKQEKKRLNDAIREAQEDSAKVKLDPKRYFNNMGTWNKIVAAIGAAASVAYQARTGKDGPNPMVEAIMNAVDKDLDLQKVEMQQKRDKISDLRGSLSSYMETVGDERTARNLARAMALDATKAKAEEINSRLTNSAAKTNLQGMIADLQARRDAEIASAMEKSTAKTTVNRTFVANQGAQETSPEVKMRKFEIYNKEVGEARSKYETVAALGRKAVKLSESELKADPLAKAALKNEVLKMMQSVGVLTDADVDRLQFDNKPKYWTRDKLIAAFEGAPLSDREMLNVRDFLITIMKEKEKEYVRSIQRFADNEALFGKDFVRGNDPSGWETLQRYKEGATKGPAFSGNRKVKQ
jgi:hypothetical protein